MTRTILHVDMDAFFASVEQRDDPALRNKPILVGGGRGGGGPDGSGKRGVVTTASYEARVFGCRSAMPMAQAKRLCPQAIVVPVRMGVYSSVSRQVMAVLNEFTPDVEPVSIDEAFMDVTGSLHLFGDGVAIARLVKARIREVTGLCASVGVAPNKFLAKVASDLNKPDGLAIITAENAAAMLGPMSIRTLFGIGPKTADKLERFGIRTVADFRTTELPKLRTLVGDQADGWLRLANGADDRVVHQRERQKSIGKEQTFGDDVESPDQLRAVLMGQVEDAARRMREDALKCSRITVKLRTPDFTTITRAATLPEPSDSTSAIWSTARTLFDAWLRERPGPLRLLGVSLSGFEQAAQPTLFATTPTKANRIDATADAIVKRFGATGLTRGAQLSRRK